MRFDSQLTKNLRQKILSHFIQQIEAALQPAASQYVPEGTEPKAVAYGIACKINVQIHHRFTSKISQYFSL
jgi:hypothetical protein